MGRHQLNKEFLKGAEVMIRAHRSRYVLCLAMCDDGTVDVNKNNVNVSEEEFVQAVRTFLDKYPTVIKKGLRNWPEDTNN